MASGYFVSLRNCIPCFVSLLILTRHQFEVLAAAGWDPALSTQLCLNLKACVSRVTGQGVSTWKEGEVGGDRGRSSGA